MIFLARLVGQYRTQSFCVYKYTGSKFIENTCCHFLTAMFMYFLSSFAHLAANLALHKIFHDFYIFFSSFFLYSKNILYEYNTITPMNLLKLFRNKIWTYWILMSCSITVINVHNLEILGWCVASACCTGSEFTNNQQMKHSTLPRMLVNWNSGIICGELL